MDLVQLRLIDNGSGSFILQWRSVQPQVDASGAMCGFGDWGEWQTVPTVHIATAPLTQEEQDKLGL